MDESEYRKQVLEELQRQAEDQPDRRTFLDKSRSLSQRLEALTRNVTPLSEEERRNAMDLIQDPDEAPALRASALKAVSRDIGSQDESIDLLLGLLKDRSQPGEVRTAALQALQKLAFTSALFLSKRPEYFAVLRSVVDDPDTRIREAAIEILAIEKDEYIQRRLNEGLDDPSKALVSAAKAIQLLGQDIHAELYPRLRQVVQNPPSPDAREEAVRLLAADPESKELLAGLMRNRDEELKIRTLSAAALQALDPSAFREEAKQIVVDDTEDERLRLTGINGLIYSPEQPSLLGDRQFDERLQRLRDESTSEQMKEAVDRYFHRMK